MKVLVLLTILIVTAYSKTLIISDNANFIETHSQFFQILKSQDTVEYIYSLNATKISLKAYDKFKYDNIIVMCTTLKRSDSKIKVEQIVDYFDNGGNVVIIGDIETSLYFKKLFYAFGVQLQQTGTMIKDHFNNQGSSDIIKTSNYENVEPFIGSKVKNPLLYRGVGMNLATFQNYQLYEIVRTQSTAFSRDMILKKTVKIGTGITLLAAVQGLNNARAILSGSLDFFSDEFFNYPQNSNKEVVKDLINWTFSKKGVLKLNNMNYHGQGVTEKESLFNVGEKIYFQANLTILDQQKHEWVSYQANDLQVQFVMLDPWVRENLVYNPVSSLYQASFYAPSKQGIYQFKIIYKKPGYSFLKQSQRVTVRPYKHDEFERFLFVAFPYYLGVFGTIFATFVFLLGYLYSSYGKPKQD